MPNNNPSGVNGWEGFGTEEPYGQATQDKALQGAAPMAGGQVAAGAIAAPKRAQKKAGKQPSVVRASPGPAPEQTLTAPPVIASNVAETWRQIAQLPIANQDPLILDIAAQAAATDGR